MASLMFRRCFCWTLRTATFANLIAISILVFGALLLRLLDLSAYWDSRFEISQGFHTEWRSHQWIAFLVSDFVLIACHIVMLVFSIIMIYHITQTHFVLYMEKMRIYTYSFIMYTFIEFCFSVFEFSFYGLNTFRLSFVVFIWLYWLARTIANIILTVIFFSRIQEMEDDMAHELRYSDKKYIHSYS